MRITIPTALSDMTLDQWLRYKRAMSAKDITERVEELILITVFCNLTPEESLRIPRKDVKEIADQIRRVLDFKPVTVYRFTPPGGKEFGFCPNLDEMTAGEYIDLDTYFDNPETFDRALAVLYRPIVKTFGDMYYIEEYQGSEKYREIMLNVSLDIALGAQVFFYRLGSELLRAMRAYLTRPEIAGAVPVEENLSLNGDGIKASIALLGEMQQKFDLIARTS